MNCCCRSWILPSLEAQMFQKRGEQKKRAQLVPAFHFLLGRDIEQLCGSPRAVSLYIFMCFFLFSYVQGGNNMGTPTPGVTPPDPVMSLQQQQQMGDRNDLNSYNQVNYKLFIFKYF